MPHKLFLFNWKIADWALQSTVLWFLRFEFVYSKLAKTNISNFLKLAHARPLVYFCFFQTNNTIFLTNKCEKCPSGFWCWDTNPQPLEHESSPVTTRLGFPPNVILLNYPLYLCSCKLQVVFSPFCTLTAFQFREKEWTRNVVLTASASSIFHPFKSGYFCTSFGLRDVIELNVMSPILC